jgi:4-alpha-glucanotransferase
VRFERSFGVQLHPTSLPGGRLGPDAYAFVEWLASAGASWWQVLPLGPPDALGSPYSSSSAFAAWRGLLADPEAPVSAGDVDAFRRAHESWASDWEAFAGAGALEDQVRFEREWTALRHFAHEHGVRLIGDMPIYVAPDSCDHLAYPDVFGPPERVAGAPPDALNEEGQVWGNPLYAWDALARTGYAWWVERMRRVLETVDAVRLDHFRGFVAYWAVPAGAETAREGSWEPGPGRALFDALARALGPLPVIVEDLGLITPDVDALRDELGLPGMAVLIWAFDDGDRNPHRIESLREETVLYTSTHDTETLAGHFGHDRTWELLERAFGALASLVVVPAQDVLGLGNEARMNRPGTTEGNWSWRLRPGELDAALAERMRRLATGSGRG